MRKKKCMDKPYTNGEVNRLIDSLLHPLYERNQLLRLVDGLAHAAVEGDVRRSAEKFVKYNLPDVAKIILKKEMEVKKNAKKKK
jgi:hypothetical protein